MKVIRERDNGLGMAMSIVGETFKRNLGNWESRETYHRGDFDKIKEQLQELYPSALIEGKRRPGFDSYFVISVYFKDKADAGEFLLKIEDTEVFI
jgi:hypothetical protein